jgi:circadian clock protein KaiB
LAKIVLSLFVTGHTPTSERAIVNLRRICDERSAVQCEIRIVDVTENPNEAEELHILATPMLIREAPLPLRRVIGDLSDMETVFDALELHELRVTGNGAEKPGNGLLK